MSFTTASIQSYNTLHTQVADITFNAYLKLQIYQQAIKSPTQNVSKTPGLQDFMHISMQHINIPKENYTFQCMITFLGPIKSSDC